MKHPDLAGTRETLRKPAREHTQPFPISPAHKQTLIALAARFPASGTILQAGGLRSGLASRQPFFQGRTT